MKKLIFVMLFTLVAGFAYSEGNEAAHGGGKKALSTYDTQDFIIEFGTPEQHSHLEEVLDSLTNQTVLDLQRSAEDHFYDKLEKSIRLSRYVIKNSDVSDPDNDGDVLYAKTIVRKSVHDEDKRFSSITYIYPAFFSSNISDNNRQAVLIHEALHRIYPSWSEKKIEDKKRTIFEASQESQDSQESQESHNSNLNILEKEDKAKLIEQLDRLKEIRVSEAKYVGSMVKTMGYGIDKNNGGLTYACQKAKVDAWNKADAICKERLGEFAYPDGSTGIECETIKEEPTILPWVTTLYVKTFFSGICMLH